MGSFCVGQKVWALNKFKYDEQTKVVSSEITKELITAHFIETDEYNTQNMYKIQGKYLDVSKLGLLVKYKLGLI